MTIVWHCIYSTPLVNKHLIKSLNIIIFWKTPQFDIHITNKMSLPNVFVSCLLKEITFYNVKVANHFHLKYLNIKAAYCVRTQYQEYIIIYFSLIDSWDSDIWYGKYWWVNLCRLKIFRYYNNKQSVAGAVLTMMLRWDLKLVKEDHNITP